MNINFSRNLAFAVGTVIPLVSLVRHFNTPEGDAVTFLVDLAVGGFLLIGVWRVRENRHSGQRFLAAAWGLTVGVLYAHVMIELEAMKRSGPPASPLLSDLGLVVNGLAVIICLAGLVTSLGTTRKHK